MTKQIPDLWPAEIVTEVVSPLAIIKFQANKLRERTKGLLEAKIRTSREDEDRVIHEFQIVVAGLNGYTYTLFSASHGTDMVYPVIVKFREWDDKAKAAYYQQLKIAPQLVPSSASPFEQVPTGDRVADTPADFIRDLEEVFNSSRTKSVLVSLIARLNEVEDVPASSNNATPPKQS